MGRSGEAFPDNAFIRREVEPTRDDAIDRAAAEFAVANAGADRAVRLQTAEDVDDAAHPSIGAYRDTAVAAPADSGEEREVADRRTDTPGTFDVGGEERSRDRNQQVQTNRNVVSGPDHDPYRITEYDEPFYTGPPPTMSPESRRTVEAADRERRRQGTPSDEQTASGGAVGSNDRGVASTEADRFGAPTYHGDEQFVNSRRRGKSGGNDGGSDRKTPEFEGDYFDGTEPPTERYDNRDTTSGSTGLATVGEAHTDSGPVQRTSRGDLGLWLPGNGVDNSGTDRDLPANRERPARLENTDDILKIVHTFGRVQDDLLRHSHPGIDPDQELQYSGETPVDAVSLLVVSGFIDVQRDRQRYKGVAVFQPQNPSGTELAERVASDHADLVPLISWAAEHPTGIRADAIEVARSRTFKESLNAALAGVDQADAATQPELAKQPDAGKSTGWRRVAEKFGLVQDQDQKAATQAATQAASLELLRSNARVDTLRGARESREWTHDWFVEQIRQYQREGEAGLWASMRQHPDEVSPSEPKGKYNKDFLDGLRIEYNMHTQFGDDTVKGPNGAEFSREQGRNALWIHVIKPLDQAWRDTHPDDPISPHTLERTMRLAAVHYANEIDKAPVKQRQDGTKYVDVMETADGLMIKALDYTLGRMSKNAAAQAYRADETGYIDGDRPTQVHPDYAKLMALRIAVSSQAELDNHNGAAASQEAFVTQVQEFLQRQLTMEEAAMYRDPNALADLLQGRQKQMTNSMFELETQRIAAETGRVLGAKGPVEAQKSRMLAIRELGERIAGRAMSPAELGTASSGVIAGHTEAELMRLDVDELRGLRQQIRSKRMDAHGNFGVLTSASDPLRSDTAWLNERIAALEDKGRAGVFEAARADLLSRDAQAALERLHPADQTAHIAVGRKGSAIPLAGLIAAEGQGVIANVSTSGEGLPKGVLTHSRQLSERLSAGRMPTKFSEQVGPTPRDEKYALFVAEGSDAPVSLKQHPEHILEQLTPEGIAVIPIRPESGWIPVARELIRLAKTPRYAGRFSVEAVPSADLKVQPSVTYVADGSQATIVVSPLMEDGGNNDTYSRLLSRLETMRELSDQPPLSLDELHQLGSSRPELSSSRREISR